MTSNRKPIEFVYFDLGNILCTFDPKIACNNVAELAGTSAEQVDRMLYASGNQDRYETGEITTHQYWTMTRESLELDEDQFPKEAFTEAISDMFQPINEMVEVIKFAREHVGRIGVLSNTCPAHWNWVRRQPWPVSQIDYDVRILSHEVKSMKPDAAIYEAAESAASVAPHRILFVDDKLENIEAARERGWVAEQCLGGDPVLQVLKSHLLEPAN